MRIAVVMFFTLGLGCSDSSSGKASTATTTSSSETRAAAEARLDLVRRSVQAFPAATATLPACTPAEGVRVLALASADVLTGGKGSPSVPGFARPRADAAPFEDLKRDDAAARGVRILDKMRALALFAADRVDPPKVSGRVVSSTGRIDGRVVVFDLEAKPTCMSPISVVGKPLTKSYVREDANSADVDRKATHDHEQALLTALTQAIDAAVKTGGKPHAP